MPATKRWHSPSPPTATARLPSSSYASSTLFPPDKPSNPHAGLGLGLPSPQPTSLPSSSMRASSPHRLAYRDMATDTESDDDASDDEIDMSLASFIRWTDTPTNNKGKGKAEERTGGPSSLDAARERNLRRRDAGKLRAELGRRQRSRVPSGVRPMSRVVSPTESIYVMTQGMSSLQTSPDEQAVSSALDTDRRSSSPSPVPSSPEPSELDTPTIRRKHVSRVMLSKSKKRRADAVRSSTALAKARTDIGAWDTHQEGVMDYNTLASIATRMGFKLAPISSRSGNAALGPSESTSNLNTGAEADAEAEADEAGPSQSHKRAPESDDKPPSTPAIIEDMITPTQRRRHVRVQSPPAQVQEVAVTLEVTPKTPTRMTRPSSQELVIPRERKVSRTVASRVPLTPLPSSPPGPSAIDVIEDAVLDTASEDESVREEPTPTKAKKAKVAKAAKASETNTRKRYAQAVPKANRTAVPRRSKHQAAPSRQPGRDTQQLHRKSPTSLLPVRERKAPRIRFARRPVALRGPRRSLYWVRNNDESRAVSGAEYTQALRSRQVTERARRALLERYRQRFASAPLSGPSPTTPRHKRRLSSLDDDDIIVDELLHDVEMRDSEAVEVVDEALVTQLAGRKRPSLPLDASPARAAQRAALRIAEVDDLVVAIRSRAASRKFELDPARAGERKEARAMLHLAARAAAEFRREEEAERSVDNALVTAEFAEISTPIDETAPSSAIVAETVTVEIEESGPTSDTVVNFLPQPTVLDGPLEISSDAVDDLLTYELPSPVAVVEAFSQPAVLDEPAEPIIQSIDAVEESAPFEPALTAATVPAAISAAQAARERVNRRRSNEGRRRRHPDQIDGPHRALSRAGGPRVISLERRRATTAPLEERHAEAGPSRLNAVEEEPMLTLPDSPTPMRHSTPLFRESTPEGSAEISAPAEPSVPEGMQSPPPRYEYPFYPIIRLEPRRTVRPPPPATPPPRARAASNPPSYMVVEYRHTSPAPPPPYNAMTDCATIMPPVFLPERAPRGLELDLGPARRQGRRSAGRALRHAESVASNTSDDDWRAPGTWPRDRPQRATSSRAHVAADGYGVLGAAQVDEVDDVEMRDEGEEEQGRIAALGRWLGLWR